MKLFIEFIKMVFEHLAAFFIDKFLGNYIEDFDSHQLKLNLWHGLFSIILFK